MKCIIALTILATLMCLVQGQDQSCGEVYCGEGQCCSGSFYARHCRDYSNDGEPCERPNKYNSYKTACPCKEGMFCNVINRCQKYE
uniref:U24-Lycotoxin-Lsp1a_1 n=1 Tax=Lycosa sp. SGP-2016 TaxID=1905177 RepID=A0A482ZEZ8_9ARAC